MQAIGEALELVGGFAEKVVAEVRKFDDLGWGERPP